ncbi:MAG: ABC transporter substrate-binding protein [Chromatiaceae bacterium]|nr:ABC transporter substrate-binding protein [Candidatus Thioaporhodococcus sediminis]
MGQRRRFLGQALTGLAWASLAGAGLPGCAPRQEPLVRIATNVFPGYELMYLAAERGHFSPDAVRMVEMPSATACLQALAAGSVEGAGLTLDEVISARADNMRLKVVAVLDVSLGADVLIAKSGITALTELRGRRIGVEQTAVGAVMLDAVLSQAGLSPGDVQVVYATVDRHRDLFLNDGVDALVTFEPVPSQLAPAGAKRLFDSSVIPGRIVDVLAVREEVIGQSPGALRQLLAGHFLALAELRSDPRAASPIIARRLGIPPEAVPAAYHGLDLPDAAANRTWLAGRPSQLETAAAELQRILLKAGLIRQAGDLEGLGDAHFLPKAGS